MNNTIRSVFHLPLRGGLESAVHRFQPEGEGMPLLLLHGSIEDSRIFHSRSGKGLAPFLAAQGFDVFAPDLAGKGESKPRISRGFPHDQYGFLSDDVNRYMAHIAAQHPGKAIRLGAHSWGGVLLLAWMARYNPGFPLGPAVFFGSKRRIGVMGIKRLFMVDLMWTAVGTLAAMAKGYLPAKALGMGSENEPTAFYRQVNRWVYSKQWRDARDGFDYRSALAETALPPILYFAGKADQVLGHPRDVRRLMEETQAQNAKYTLLAKDHHFARDYGHIDMLTHKRCTDDHFLEALSWWQRGESEWLQ